MLHINRRERAERELYQTPTPQREMAPNLSVIFVCLTIAVPYVPNMLNLRKTELQDVKKPSVCQTKRKIKRWRMTSRDRKFFFLVRIDVGAKQKTCVISLLFVRFWRAGSPHDNLLMIKV